MLNGGNIVESLLYDGSTPVAGVTAFGIFAATTETLYDANGDGTPEAASGIFGGVLASNGGPIQTIAILEGGAAQNAGINSWLPADTFDRDGDLNTGEFLPVDARGLLRVFDTTVDLGAFEVQDNFAPVPSGDLTATVAEGGSVAITPNDLFFIDPDDAPPTITFTASVLTNGIIQVDGVTQNTFTGADIQAGLVTFVHNDSETTAASFQVIVEDGDEDASTPIASTFNLTVTPVNDAPTAILPSGTAVDEFAAAGTVVATLSATDADGIAPFTFTLLDDAGGRFEIVGNELRVANSLLLDFEQAASHDISIRVEDAAGAPFEDTFTITVDNVDPENIVGTAGDDTIFGGALADSLSGIGGADVLNGGGGDDFLSGGADGLVDALTGGSGNDTFNLENEFDTVTELADGGTDTIRSTITRSLVDYANVENLILEGIAAINGTGNALANTITGNASGNVLDGGAGADALIGGAGNDTYVLDNGTDTVTDTGGIDTITSIITRSLAGFTSIEHLTLLGTATINGTGNNLANIVTGNAAANKLYGGVGNDTLRGENGHDTIYGGTGNDIAYGGTGNDKLYGEAGNDTLRGDAGVDVLTGAASKDVLYGGADRDTFDYNFLSDSRGSTRDFLADFQRRVDDIDVSTIDANTKLGGNQKFAFIGAKAFTQTAGELHYVKSGSNVRVEGDVNGDGKADFAIDVKGTGALASGDFIL